MSIAFVMDDRLSSDRKQALLRCINRMKSHFDLEVLPQNTTEESVMEGLRDKRFQGVILPWYQYLAWKRLEAEFGVLRLGFAKNIGYFSEAVLPFELTELPPYQRLHLLDFHRFSQKNIETLLQALLLRQDESGLAPFLRKNSVVFTTGWNQSHQAYEAIRQVLESPLLRRWSDRFLSLHLYFSCLQSLIKESVKIEIIEAEEMLLIKSLFQDKTLPLKTILAAVWPSENHPSRAIREMLRHCDFTRVSCFPEEHHIEVTSIFTPDAQALNYPGEMRGIWVEPRPLSQLETENTTPHLRRITFLELNELKEFKGKTAA